MKIKGFDKDLKCRGYQFKVGKTYEIKLPEGYELTEKDLCSDNACDYFGVIGKVFNLVYRQRAEIERLEHIRKGDKQLINSLNKCYILAKSEAIKEFAERLKRYSFVDNLSLDGKETVYVDDIDKLVKEMTEKNNEH